MRDQKRKGREKVTKLKRLLEPKGNCGIPDRFLQNSREERSALTKQIHPHSLKLLRNASVTQTQNELSALSSLALET